MLASDRKLIRRKARGQESGLAIFFICILMAFLIPMVGLSIDVGTMFVIRSRVGAAVDSAALAAGRSLNLGSDIPAVQASAIAAANTYFTANFPAGYMSTTSPVVDPQFTLQLGPTGVPNGVLIISVSASVQAPTYFMRVFNVSTVRVAGSGTATRRNLVMMLVLDKSSSMGARVTTGIPATLPANASSCDAMVSSSAQFVSFFSPYDTVGMVSFNSTAFLDYAPSSNFKAPGAAGVTSAIGNITCGANTNTTAALNLAGTQITAVGLQLATNVIVLFTDGVANGVSANFPIRTQVDTRYSGPVSTVCGDPLPSNNANYKGCPKDGNNNPVNNPGLNNTGANPYNLDAAGKFTATTYPNSNGVVYGGKYPYIPSPAIASANDTPQNRAFCTDSSGTSLCTQMPACTTQNGTLRGVITQTAGFSVNGGSRGGLFDVFSGDANAVIPPGCPTSGTSLSQTIAFIPAVDVFGNATTGPKDNWLYQVNNQCVPNGTPLSASATPCKNIGGPWSAYPNIGIGRPSNTFQSGPYQGFFRPDTPNAIGVVSMNTAINQASAIRATAGFNITIDAIYLQGNGGDPVDRDFLPIIANVDRIPPLVYEPVGTPDKANPFYQNNQQKGIYLATTSNAQLTQMFLQIASSLLRLSH
jgi:Flp pilus assembly protein TadG